MLFRDETSLDDSAEAAAARIGDIDAETLLKDYWVTEALRVLAANYHGFFAFKGGTSLTKAVRCVDRFSEDVDILITGKPDDMSYDSLMKAMATDVVGATELVESGVFSKRNVKRDVRFRYPTRHGSLYDPEVILEMGRRGTTTPGVIAYSIRPMLSDVAPESLDLSLYADLVEFSVDVVHPARTLWEKVALLHTEASNETWRDRNASRYVRHYGDVGALLGLADVREMLADSDTRMAMDAEVRETSAVHFGDVPVAPDGGYAFSPAFRLTDDYAAHLATHFDATIDLLWAPTSRPTLVSVLDAVDASSHLLDTTAS